MPDQTIDYALPPVSSIWCSLPSKNSYAVHMTTVLSATFLIITLVSGITLEISSMICICWIVIVRCLFYKCLSFLPRWDLKWEKSHSGDHDLLECDSTWKAAEKKIRSVKYWLLKRACSLILYVSVVSKVMNLKENNDAKWYCCVAWWQCHCN